EEGRRLAKRQSARARAGLTRKEFVCRGAAGLGGAVLSGALLSPGVARAAGGALKPTDLTFTTTAQYRPFEIIAKGFVALDDDFSSGSGGYKTFAPAPENKPGTAGVAGGVLSVSGEKYFSLFASRSG